METADISEFNWSWFLWNTAASSVNPDLKFVELNIISNSECAAYYGPLKSDTLCVDSNGGAESTCNGDSGGPLVITEADGLPTEVGITSFVSSLGCESGGPAGFARVTEFLDWLETNAGVTIRP
jgi:secreted trypsin-like serine protease